MAERALFLMRHGRTLQQETGERRVDDPLADAGRAQARGAREECARLPVALVFVSPLRRALETALLAFGSRGDEVRFVPLPDLRELSRTQSAARPVSSRNQGSPLRTLKTDFPDPRIDWSAVEAAVAASPTQEWWEPHGSYMDAHFRAMAVLQEVRARLDASGEAAAAVVAHEGLFRCWTGHAGFYCARVYPASLMLTPVCDPMASGGPAVPLPSVVLRSTLAACADRAGAPAETRDAVVVLGCSVEDVCVDRVVAGLALRATLQARAGAAAVPLIYAGAAADVEYGCALRQMGDGPDGPTTPPVAPAGAAGAAAGAAGGGAAAPGRQPHLWDAVILDQSSRTTVCNAAFAVSRLWHVATAASGGVDRLRSLEQQLAQRPASRWRLHVVSSDFHMPRSLALFIGRLQLTGASEWCSVVPCSGAPPLRASAHPKLLCDAVHHVGTFSDAARLRSLGFLPQAGPAAPAAGGAAGGAGAGAALGGVATPAPAALRDHVLSVLRSGEGSELLEPYLLSLGHNLRRYIASIAAPEPAPAAAGAPVAAAAAAGGAGAGAGAVPGPGLDADTLAGQRGAVDAVAKLLQNLPKKALAAPGALEDIRAQLWAHCTAWLPHGTRRPERGFLLAEAPLNGGGSTALHYAASAGAAGMAADLIYYCGAGAGAPGMGGRSPADFAEGGGHADLAAWLRRVAAQQAALRP